MKQELQPQQVRYLKSQAHHLKPLAVVGKNGVTKAFELQVSSLLDRHELLKIKFNDFKSERKGLFASLVSNVSASEIGMLGNTGILFRQNKNPKLQRYTLP